MSRTTTAKSEPRKKDLDFVISIDDSHSLKDIQKNFFGGFKITLSNQDKRAKLETLLEKAEYSGEDEQRIKGMLTEFREEVRLRLVEMHDQWIAHLKAKKILEDRSDDTYFNGWQA